MAHRVAVLMPNWVGDAVMCTAALRVLRLAQPSATILGIMRPVIAETLAGTDFFDEVLPYDPRHAEVHLRFWSVARRVRQWKASWFFCFPNSIRATLLACFSGASKRWGWAGGLRRWCFSSEARTVQRGSRQNPVSAVDYYLSIVRSAGLPADSRSLSLATRPRDEVAADEALRRLGFNRPRPMLALNPGAAYGPAKCWPPESFAALARQWVQHFDSYVLVLCGPSEQRLAAGIERLARHPHVRSLAGFEPDMGRTKSCIRRARLMVSTDSGPRHIAAAFGVPVVTLFGPTDPRWSENYHPLEEKLTLDLPCQYCARRHCPLEHHRCMRDLTVERVWPVAVRLWQLRLPEVQAS